MNDLEPVTHRLSAGQAETLELEWLCSRGMRMDTGCKLIHSHSCTMEFLTKLWTVCKVGARYYVAFHLVPLMIKLKKSNNNRERVRAIMRTTISYSMSVLFMGLLVGGLKGSLCVASSKIPIPLDGFFLIPASLTSALSILLQGSSRRVQIGYFVLAKALGSLYTLFKRQGLLRTEKEGTFLHVLGMAVLYHVYCDRQQLLKYRSMFKKLWGDAQ